MTQWLALKSFLKKAWVWLKHNWYVPAVLLYTLVLWLLFRKKDKALEVLEIRSESYKKQIEAINNIHKEEIEKKDKILDPNDYLLIADKKIEKDYQFSFEESKKNLYTDKSSSEEVEKDRLENNSQFEKTIYFSNIYK